MATIGAPFDPAHLTKLFPTAVRTRLERAGEADVELAGRIFEAAHHPRSFVSLDGADHLLTGRADAAYVADVLSSWASRYLPAGIDQPGPVGDQSPERGVTVTETGDGDFQ